MTRLSFAAAAAFAWMLCAHESAHAAAFSPGSNKTFKWTGGSFEGAGKAGKPILLYVYDPEKKDRNYIARHYEMELFPSDEAKTAVGSHFTVVKVAVSAKGWPEQILAGAKGGAACYILAPDGTVMAAWSADSRPDRAAFAASARRAALAHQAAQAKVQQENRPATPAYVPPAEAKKEPPPKTETTPGVNPLDAAKAPPPQPKKADEQDQAPKLEDE